MKEYRYRLTFRRFGPISFLSHLDMQRLFQKAIKRAGLDVSFSKGFNPHQLTSFALPLSTGMEAEEEYFELELEGARDGAELVSALNARLPDGIESYSAVRMAPDEKTAASSVYGAVYEILLPFDAALQGKLDALIAEALAKTEIIIEKRGKSGVTEIDMRSRVLSVENVSSDGEIRILASLSAGSAASLKPEALCEYLCCAAGAEFAPYKIRYVRKKLLSGER